MKQDIHNYEDIINLPHHTSKKHPQMASENRAAQFAPFAALTGYKEEISETGRITETKLLLDENKKMLINIELQQIHSRIKEHPRIDIMYFIEDARKEGGAYHTLQNSVKSIDEYHRTLLFMDGTCIKIDDIYDIKIV